MGRFISLLPQAMMMTPIMSISCADLFTVCQVPLEQEKSVTEILRLPKMFQKCSKIRDV